MHSRIAPRFRGLAHLLATALFVAAQGCTAALWQPGWLPDRDDSKSAHKEPAPRAPDRAKSQPTEPSETNQDVAALPPALMQDGWIAAISAPHAKTPTSRRWRHPALDELMAEDPADRPGFAALAKHPNKVAATNAAIALVRLKEGAPVEPLGAAVASRELKLALRRAAVEALGEIPGDAARDELSRLLNVVGQESSSVYVAELHADLIRTLALHVDAAGDPRFAQALRATNADVRLAAVEAWGTAREGSLPVAALDLRTDPNPKVRAAAVRVVVARRDPKAFDIASVAVNDLHLDVRMSAIAALGDLGGEDATRLLRQLVQREREVVRAAAIAALAKAGDETAVLAAAEDESWHVRRAVAAALVGIRDAHDKPVANKLLSDRSNEVRRQMLATLDAWPLEQAGPLLLTAMELPLYQTRKDAAAQLARRWPSAEAFSCDAPAERRVEMLADLRERWRKEHGVVDPGMLAEVTQPPALARSHAVSPQRVAHVTALVARLESTTNATEQQRAARELTAIGPELCDLLAAHVREHGDVLPEIVYREVLPPLDPAFAALDKLSSRDVNERRFAAKQLAELAANQPLGPLAVARLGDVGARETDALVWRELLRAVKDDPSETAVRLAYAGVSHPSPEVRRLACGNLGASRDPRHAEALVPALSDENITVVRAAVEALGQQGAMKDVAPLERLLASDDHTLRIAVASTLCRLRVPSGGPALERLARDPDPKIRRRAVAAMGDIGDAAFTGPLVELLDDELGVRVAAVESLDKIAGGSRTAANALPVPSLSDRVDRWKAWWKQRQPAGDQSAERATPDFIR